MDRITDYASLVTAVRDLVDLEVGNTVDAFIQLVENEFGSQLDSNLQEITESLAVMVAGTMFPDDRRAVLRVSVDDLPVERLHIGTALTTYKNWTPGRPRAYSVTGGNVSLPGQQHLQWFPPPPDDTSYTAEVTTKIIVPALTATNTTNWLLSVAPGVYLYGTALHAVAYNGDATNFAMYKQLHDSAAASILSELEKYQMPQKTVSLTGAGGYENWLP